MVDLALPYVIQIDALVRTGVRSAGHLSALASLLSFTSVKLNSESCSEGLWKPGVVLQSNLQL